MAFWNKLLLRSSASRQAGKPNEMAWNVLCQGKKIGELVAGRPDSQSEFWVEYTLNLVDETYGDMAIEAESWYEKNIVLQNVADTGYTVTDYLINIRGDGKVALRCLL